MNIGIDGTGIWGLQTGAPSGLINYTLNIIKNLVKVDRINNYQIYYRNGVPAELENLNSSTSFRIIKSRDRKLLQQITLPLVAKRDDLDLMFFPFNSASILFPCPTVTMIHDLHPYVVPEQFAIVHGAHAHGRYRAILNMMYWKQILKISSKRADRVIVPSTATAKDVERIFNVPSEKISVVFEGVDRKSFNSDTDGVDLNKFRDQYQLPNRYVLCVGTHGYKNLEGSVRSFGVVKQSRPEDPVKLVIAGNPQRITPDVTQLIKDLNLEDDVVVTGFFPDEGLKHLYQCAEFLLFPSFYEGFGLPVVEAFACGTPVVTSKSGSLPEVAGAAALLVDAHDAEDIAAAMIKLLSDDAFRAEKRSEGLARASTFTWEKTANRTLHAFVKTLASA